MLFDAQALTHGDAFMRALVGTAVETTFIKAESHSMERTIKPEILKRELTGKFLLDVRRAHARASSGEQLPGAIWMDPERLGDWADNLPRDRDIVLYCVHGESVSNSVVDALHAKGYKARYIEGGIDGWKSAGGATEPKS